MTSDELKGLLDSIADSMDTMGKLLTPPAIEKLSAFLGLLEKSVDILLPLLRVVSPDATREEFLGEVGKASALVHSLAVMVGKGDHQKVARFCRALRNRPVILMALARLL